MPRLELIKGKYSFCSSEKDLKAVLISEGYDIFPWQDPPGAHYAPHQHPHDEFIVVHSGSMVFDIKGKKYLLQAGDMLVLPEGTVHSADNEQPVAVRYFICSRD
jgi:mannose-6-phosphate isomerase-like protein (cupin superfamily)